MDLSFSRDTMTETLQRIVGAAEKRLTMPILGNVRIRAGGEGIQLDTTDLELAWKATSAGEISPGVDVTVAVKKLLDIVRAAPPESTIQARVEGDHLSVGFGASRFSLATLPGADYPEWELESIEHWVEMPQRLLRRLIEATMFSMAQQDVRYYLQGLLLVAQGDTLRAVATDGHRLAVSEADLETPLGVEQECIVPRKTVQELRRNLLDDETPVAVGFAPGQVAFDFGVARLTSKVIDGRFPDYERVIPVDLPGNLVVEREVFRQALARVAIVTSEKYRGVRLIAHPDGCRVVTHNAEREEAEEELPAQYQGEEIEIGFNLIYLQDVLNAIDAEQIRIDMRDGGSSALIRSEPVDRARYVVMPMRL
ncbi:DNA polymerase III beta subunit [Thioalkalivibrio nitratireducens DSM 14787]|uniref:Beta sliding clamp n=1 Tax=Thioalkalivibrio nitratireducens (strain DSM 14787 / UNIQEM 213 / ALEN2) TaxID=1255043 RepID=L0E2C5_THIND|nr:DNA polymerase III subunit beta [Thioalkalivibrio nitratireducens]AGA35438.1 DNA polymerase III beta subunit [Thioalkalivibrio nitratireducens DSM 14787]